MSGKEDRPENYNLVTQETERSGKTTLTISQDNVNSEAEKKHAADNWKIVLSKLKEVVEVLPRA